MIELSTYAQRRLARIQRADFGIPVTAYIVNAYFSSCCCVGNVYGHVRRQPDGKFADGHLIRTSDICIIDDWEICWSFRTESGSHYVVVTFKQTGGRSSLAALINILVKGFHVTARGIH